jgi:hypothetical protein
MRTAVVHPSGRTAGRRASWLQPLRSYAGPAIVDGHVATVALRATQPTATTRIEWAGTAFIPDPRIDLLDFSGTVEIVIDRNVAYAYVADITPVSRFLYLRGHQHPPFPLG